MNQIEVLVKEKSSGDPRTMTYKSFLDLQDRFELIGQCDEQGNLILGDPNLNPRHQKVAVNDVAVHAVDSGMTMEEKLKKKAELVERYSAKPVEKVDEPKPTMDIVDEPQQDMRKRKKPGPKPKQPA